MLAFSKPSKRLRLAVTVALTTFLVGCADRPSSPPVYPPLNYGYLGPIVLKTQSLAIEDHTQLNPVEGNIGYKSPIPPIQAVRHMANERLVAAGGANSDKVARFVIDQASILHEPGGDLVGKVAVHLDILNPNGHCIAYVSAQAGQTLHPDPSLPVESPQNLYDVTRDMMKTLNVEFEYQVRHGLKKWLMPNDGLQTDTTVQSQNIPSTPTSPLTGAEAGAEGITTLPHSQAETATTSPTTSTAGTETPEENTSSVLTLPQTQLAPPMPAAAPPTTNVGTSIMPSAAQQPTTVEPSTPPTAGPGTLAILPPADDTLSHTQAYTQPYTHTPTPTPAENTSMLTLPQKPQQQVQSLKPTQPISPPASPSSQPKQPKKTADFNPVFPAGE